MKDSTTNHLLEIVVAARDLKVDTSYMQGWKRIFGEGSSLDIHRKIGLLYKLIDAAAQEVLAIDPSQTEAVNHWRSQLYNGLSSCTSKKWMDFHPYLDNHTVNYLRIQSALVQMRNGENALDREELIRAKQLLQEAIDEIAGCDLSDDAKLALIRRVRTLIAAIEDYRLTGNEVVFDQFKSTVYDLAANQEVGKKGMGVKLSEAIQVLANIVTSATGVQQLAGPAMKLLGWGK